MRMRILGLAILAGMVICPFAAFADDITAAQMVQFDQTGTRNNIDVISGTINTVDEVTNVTSVDTVDSVTEVANVTSVDTVDLVATVSTVNAVTNVASVDLVDVVTEVANVTSVDTVDSITSVERGTFTLQDKENGYNAKIFPDGSVYVKSTAEAGISKSSYGTLVAVPAGATATAASYVVTAGTTYYIDIASLVSSGLATLRVLSGETEILRVMSTPSCQTAIMPAYQAITVAAGVTITLEVKNRETVAMDITAMLAGSEKTN